MREREPELRDDFDVPVERFAAGLLAADDRVEPELDCLAALEVDFFAPLDRDVDRVLFDAPPVERFAVDRPEVDLRAPLERLELPREAEEADPLPLVEPLSAGDHLPDITRCAASATASAMSDPNLVALDMTLLAARSAVSAASRPASRIFLRAAGLALIAAAAAARPAASISLLIAAFASLSTVLSVERDDVERGFEEVEREELLRADFAIFYLPPSVERHFKAVPVP